LVADVYASLSGMPGVDEQPGYYKMLREVEQRRSTVFAAVDEAAELLGCVDFIDDMQHYGAGGTASRLPDAAGIRLLAVKPEWRGSGIGKALTGFCIERARSLGRSRVILHTTGAMQTAWGMYERLGFERLPEIDFSQGRLAVFGFQLALR
jgi:ribosomal protein S18 acetylase RimI-like enzyme